MLINYFHLLLLFGIFPSAQALFSNSSFFDWSDFSNNFATDLSPLLSLFGESPTKQFLSESTSRLDSILFGIGPLGIVTTVVSVIRLYGNARWKSIIGRSQEPRGVAESELCSSTSADVCELWSHGGISRVFGRPKILAFIFTRKDAEFYPKVMGRQDDPLLCGIDTPRNSLSRLGVNRDEEGYHADEHWREESPKIKATALPTKLSEAESSFAPVPNMTLNIGIQPISARLEIAVVAFSLALQGGFLAFAYWATYRELTFYESDEGQSPTTWAFVLTFIGTGLLSIGMGLCAWLVDEKSCERRFARKDGDGRVFWLQPGGQRAGDQLFNAFAYNDTSKEARYMTSWRVEGPTSSASHMTAYIAVIMTMLGWAMQFIGLRGVPDAIALYLLAMTIIMAIIRAVIRSTRLGENKNDLHDWNQEVEGHELDWQAISLIQCATKHADMSWWRLHDDYSDLHSRGDWASDQQMWNPTSGIDATQWITATESLGIDSQGYDSGSLHAKAMRFRARFAYLISDPAVDSGQAWPTEAREMASRLQNAFEIAADYIFSHFPLKGDWKDATQFAWSITCRKHDGRSDSICLYMRKTRLEDGPGSWSIDIHQLEAVIGLWSWSTRRIENSKWPGPKSIVVPEAQTSGMAVAVKFWVPGSLDHLQVHESPNLVAPAVLSVAAATTSWETSPHQSRNTSSPVFTRLYLRTLDSPLQLMAQDLFTIFMSRIATIMDPLQEIEQKEPTSADLFGIKTRRYLGLTNPHLEVLADAMVSAGVASRKEAFMSVVPVLALKKKLPDINPIAESLLAKARELRRDGQLRTSEALLDGLYFLGPLTMRNRALRQLGQIYRAEMREKHIDRNGTSGLLIPRYISTRDVPYKDKVLKLEAQICGMRKKLDMFNGKTGQDLLKVAEDEEAAAKKTVQLYESMLERLRIEPGQRPYTSSGPSAATCSVVEQAKFLTLNEDFALAECKSEELLDILKAAIKWDIPELVEDLWSVRPSLIDKTVRLDRPFDFTGSTGTLLKDHRDFNRYKLSYTCEGLEEGPSPLWWAIQATDDQDTLESLLEWPGVRMEKVNSRQQTALFLAAHESNSNAARLLLQKGAIWSARDIDGDTPLVVAAGAGDHATVHQLLDLGAADEASTMERSLRKAFVMRHKALADELLHFARLHHDHILQRGGLWHIPDKDGNAALVVAVEAGDHGTVLRLLELGAGDKAAIMEKSLREAVAMRHKAVADELLQFARLHHDQNRLQTILEELVLSIVISESRVSSFQVLGFWVKWLVINGANINAEVSFHSTLTERTTAQYDLMWPILNWYDRNLSHKCTALSAAVMLADQPQLFKFLVDEFGADVHKQTAYYGNVLMLAIPCSIGHAKYLVEECHADVKSPVREGRYGNALVMILRCRYNHDVKIRPEFGNTSIEWSSILEYVLSHYQPVEIDEPVEHGLYGSALVAAAASGNPENVQTLVDKCPNIAINAQVIHGSYGSALVAAVWGGSIEIMSMLVSLGGDLNMKVENGQYESALLAAVHWQAPHDMLGWLIDNGANPNVHLHRGQHESVLCAATAEHRVDAVQLLLAQEVRPVADHIRAAVETARNNGYLRMVELLQGAINTVKDDEAPPSTGHESGAQAGG